MDNVIPFVFLASFVGGIIGAVVGVISIAKWAMDDE